MSMKKIIALLLALTMCFALCACGKTTTAESAAPAADTAPAEAAPAASVQGAVTTIKHGKVVISIKEGKDIYLELPI